MIDEDMESYEYTPLQGETSFRLLYLQPGTDSEIFIQLQEHSTGTHPPYEALSYTWHTPEYEGSHIETVIGSEPTEAILCDDRCIWVTPNCQAALLQLRQPDTIRILWVDAICINQKNMPERNQQVLLMYNIYRASERVCCWIGPGNQYITALFDYIQIFVAQAKEPHRLSELAKDEESTAKYEAALSAFKETRSAILISYKEAQGTPLFFGFSSLRQRSYWDRVWVLQEIRAATKKIIICGQAQIDYVDLGLFVLVDSTLNIKAEQNSSGEHQYPQSWIRGFLEKLEAQKYVMLGGNDISALETLCDGLPFLSTDPKDKVFAMIGLSDQLRELVPSPDYSQTTAEVYTNVAAAILDRTKSLDLLYYCFGQACEPGLPSWVPDWSSAERPWWKSQYRESHRFQATRGLTPWLELQRYDDSLKVKGIIVGSIDSVAGYYDHSLLEMANGIRQRNPPDTWEETYGTDSFFLTYPYAIWREWCDMSKICASEPWVSGKGPEGDELWHLFNAVLSKPDLHHGYVVWREILEHEKLSPVQRARYIATINQVDKFSKWTSALAGLTLCTTTTKRLALVPHAARKGDSMALIAGCSLPFVLRPNSEGFGLIGASYVHGIMQGEAVTGAQDQFATIVLAGATEVDKMARLGS